MIYPTDYYYSADLSQCDARLGNMGGFTTYCADSAWMEQSSAMWTVTPRMNEDNKSWYIKSTGGTDYSSVTTSSYLLIPAVYLDSRTPFIDGDGSSGNPYKIYPLA